MKRIARVTMVFKPIPIPGIEEPMPKYSKIEIDKSYPVAKREHQVVFQQGNNYGTVGDRCYSISDAYLRQLDKEGYISTSPNPYKSQ